MAKSPEEARQIAAKLAKRKEGKRFAAKARALKLLSASAKAIPIVGAIAGATLLVHSLEQKAIAKGLPGAVLDEILDNLPGIGWFKTVYEFGTGRDLVPNRDLWHFIIQSHGVFGFHGPWVITFTPVFAEDEIPMVPWIPTFRITELQYWQMKGYDRNPWKHFP
jgi:hypothetical protein